MSPPKNHWKSSVFTDLMSSLYEWIYGVANPVNIRVKGDILMVKITTAEKNAVLCKFPNAHIRRTMKQDSGRHHYFCEESLKIMEFLKSYRAEASRLEG